MKIRVNFIGKPSSALGICWRQTMDLEIDENSKLKRKLKREANSK